MYEEYNVAKKQNNKIIKMQIFWTTVRLREEHFY